MANAKKKRSDAECKAQFDRTVKRTGKWRGYTPEQYVKKFGASGFRSGHSVKECNHHFTEGSCVHCHMTAKDYYIKHPKKLAAMMKLYKVKKPKQT